MLISAAGKMTIAVILKTWEWDEFKRGFSRSIAKCKNWLLKNCNRWKRIHATVEISSALEKDSPEEMQRKPILCTCGYGCRFVICSYVYV